MGLRVVRSERTRPSTDLSSPERKSDGLGFMVDYEDAILELVAIHEHIPAD